MIAMAYDLIDDPHYESLSYSTGYAHRKDKRLAQLLGYWAVYYHGRVLHDGLHRDEVEMVRDWYFEGRSSTDACWQFLTTPGKQPSPSTDHRRKAGLS